MPPSLEPRGPEYDPPDRRSNGPDDLGRDTRPHHASRAAVSGGPARERVVVHHGGTPSLIRARIRSRLGLAQSMPAMNLPDGAWSRAFPPPATMPSPGH